jgi:hypothetical protein
MRLMGFLGLKAANRGTAPPRGGKKPTAPASWADGTTPPWPSPDLAEDLAAGALAAGALAAGALAADRKRPGRHARPHASHPRADHLTGRHARTT